MAGVYRPRHPEQTVLYRVLFHYFDRFLAEYEGRFEKEYGFFRPIVKEVAERVGKYMARPLLSLERLCFSQKEGQVCYRYGKDGQEMERMDYLEFIARTSSHIPDKGQVTVRYYGLYANAHRGKIRKAGQAAVALLIIEEELQPVPSCPGRRSPLDF